MKKIEYVGRIITETGENMYDLIQKLEDSDYFIRKYQYDGELEIICEIYKEDDTLK